MAIYQYKAFNLQGKEITGHLDAPNSQAAHAKLKKQSLYVKELREDTGKRDRQLFPFLSQFLYHIPRKDIGLFARQLGTLLGAGISLENALEDIIDQTRNKNLQKTITEIKADITEGKKLSEAMAVHSDIFPAIYENMVKIGEATGSYESTLNRLADLEEKNAELRNKAITALIYPILMMLLTVSVVLFLLVSVVPQIESIFNSYKAELPLPTKIVIFLSHGVKRFWPILILGSILLSFLYHRYRSTPAGKLKTDEKILKIPILGAINKKLEVSKFARNLGSMLQSNVQLLGALQISKEIAGNEVFRQELVSMIKMIEEGDTLKNAVRQSIFLPHMIKGMIAAGEASDRLSELINKTADILESELDTAVKGFTKSLEPIIIIIMGLAIGVILFAIMMPIYKMTTMIGT